MCCIRDRHHCAVDIGRLEVQGVPHIHWTCSVDSLSGGSCACYNCSRGGCHGPLIAALALLIIKLEHDKRSILPVDYCLGLSCIPRVLPTLENPRIDSCWR